MAEPRYGVGMGQVDVTVQVSNLDQSKTAEVETLVETGANYTFLPTSMLRDLGIVPWRKRTFRTGDGRLVEYDVGMAIVSVNGFDAVVDVFFAQDDVQPLLGIVTLASLGLAVDPLGQRLVELELRL